MSESFVGGVEFQLPSFGRRQQRVITSDDLSVLYIFYTIYVVMETTTKLLYFQTHDINFQLLYKVAFYFTARVH